MKSEVNLFIEMFLFTILLELIIDELFLVIDSFGSNDCIFIRERLKSGLMWYIFLIHSRLSLLNKNEKLISC